MTGPISSVTIDFNPRVVRKIAIWSGSLLAFVGLLIVVPPLKTVMIILVIALFAAMLLNPIVDFFENRGIDRLLAVALVFAVLFLLFVLSIEFVVPIVSHEVEQMSSSLETQSSDQIIGKFQKSLGDAVPLLANPMIQTELKGQLDALLQKSLSLLIGLLSAVVNMVMLGFITFFFLKDGRRMKKAVVSWVPNRYFEMGLIIIHKTGVRLGRYLRGQLLVATIVGALSICALYLLGIRYYFFIGVIAGLANMIPYFGPLVGAIPAMVIALVDSGSIGPVVAVAVAFASIQLFENIFVSPFIVSKSVEVHPLTVIIVILIGGQLLGIFGMLMAVPVASIIKVTAKELYWGFKNYRILA
jgi:predicted PurR-regulated permease PerM